MQSQLEAVSGLQLHKKPVPHYSWAGTMDVSSSNQLYKVKFVQQLGPTERIELPGKELADCNANLAAAKKRKLKAQAELKDRTLTLPNVEAIHSGHTENFEMFFR